MNPHLSEGDLQRMLDEERSHGDATGAETHLAGCPACRADLGELESKFATISQRLTLLDPPDVSLDLAHAGLHRRLASSRPKLWRGHLQRAALFLLALSGIASATLPGSPVRQWVESRWSDTTAAEPVATLPETSDHEISAGASVRPVDGEIILAVDRASPSLRIRVRLADQAALSVRGIGEAADAKFRLGRGRITVEHSGGGALDVVVPRTARRVTVTVNGERVLLKEDGQLHVLAPADITGPEIIFPGHD
ncbi:hypothetical protein BH23GEM6_BH23GEM6_21710 [soil metagenome]